MPQLEPYWAAGFSFSRGHFVVNVPYDLYQPMIFQGEEMSIGIRGKLKFKSIQLHSILINSLIRHNNVSWFSPFVL